MLLLHGWPQTSFAWRKVVPLLAVGHDVIAPDLPGIGNTSRPETGYDKRTVARSVRALVRALGLSRVAVIGHDMGAQVAFAYAAWWPDEVSHLVFIEGGLPGFGQEEAMDVSRGGSWHFGFNMAGPISEELVRGREFTFVDHFMRRETVGLFDPTAVGPEEVEHYARALARPGALRSSFAYYRALPADREDNLAWDGPLSTPVLAVGAAGGYGDEAAKTMRRVAKDVRAVLIPDCGRYVPEERPAKLAEEIETFLASSVAEPA